ncbi:hypothetical protein SAMN05216419_10844 [Nitrosomonas cryotolerans]|uniref:MarR family transcriptional regulator n=1 Tax=Nitrosomonas cryotolerans ATCC 49181 TaxID=1131553 RepID=A0A1N6G336_9PROT|nr:hypothetical protein [Nitrosomonas cryotolerans]SFQ16683.1 hypothetical protein SAMN05216419_10844 [Nitrosomonas cryotolerans]SIO01907.1 hypothetical protein SAMN02743940_0526 [Nitrosomonas cryotolerans ATCC 49181]
MKASNKHQQRLKFVQALNRMDSEWMKFLQDKDVYDMNYSDLYTGLWAKQEPVRKQEALLFMRHLGPQTAKKYLDKAILIGLIIELPDPSDGRAKLIALSPELKIWLEEFFDHAIGLFKEALA